MILQFLKGLERPLALGLSTCSNNRNSPAAVLDLSYLKPVWKTDSWNKILRKKGLLDKFSMKYLIFHINMKYYLRVAQAFLF